MTQPPEAAQAGPLASPRPAVPGRVGARRGACYVEEVPRVLLLPAQLPVEVDEGTSLFDAAKRVGIAVDTACGGNGTCGLCRVRIVSGFEALSPIGPVDRKLLGDVYAVARERLACQAKVQGDCSVDVPAPRPSKRERQAQEARAAGRDPSRAGRPGPARGHHR